MIILIDMFSGRCAMKTVSAVEARKGLGHLLNLVALKRETIVIERSGKKMAVLKAYDDEPNKKEPALHEGRLNLLDLTGLGGEIWADVDVDDYLRQERAQWT
ncbi:MAG: type II toxin-antitoxin system Phd/YefM family antitoxin [Lentisphaerae bacterium]|nr:type II toxin-antitoxin system Phd/YefM family antitoxin [Lentisphaerota bacterium]